MNEQTLPELVEWKSATATIYRTKNRQRIRFEERHYDLGGVQQRFTFETYTSAKKFASSAVRTLAALVPSLSRSVGRRNTNIRARKNCSLAPAHPS